MTAKGLQVKQLKTTAHSLKPIVYIGINGLTKSVLEELDRALNDHELIKIRMHENDREARRETFAEICKTLRAEAIQLIGKIAVLYRKNPNKKQAPKINDTKPKALIKKRKTAVKNAKRFT